MKTLDFELAARFANLALDCVHREYPNKISHVLSSGADALPPRNLTPAFFGCYDWHSAVHSHWMRARLSRIFPAASFSSSVRDVLQQSLTADNIEGETAYLGGEGRISFERPYGLAWLLRLSLELHEWSKTDALVGQLAANLQPLEAAAKDRLSTWLPRLTHPVRSGEHSQTAFALGLMIDYATGQNDRNFLELLRDRAVYFYGKDENCPLVYEPSGEDFLSPALAEADVMRRVLNGEEFSQWLSGFLPQLPKDGRTDWL